MEIKKFEIYYDGGTIELETDNGIFCFDERIGSNTKGRLYNGYPKSDNSNLIENSKDLETELVESLKLYKNAFYQSSIDYFINSKQKNNMNEISREELINEYEHFLTVGDLKKYLNENNFSDDAKVVVERIEDVYYEKRKWGVYLKIGDNTFKDKDGNIVKESMEQYHPAWCCTKHKDDDKILFIHMHY